MVHPLYAPGDSVMVKPGKLKTVHLNVPVTEDDLRQLEPGNIVYLTGIIYTGREGVYQRIVGDGHAPPDSVMELSNVNFHCSPAASVDDEGNYSIGAVTATASFRFAKWMKDWFRVSNAKIIIGKGGMSEQDYKNLFVPAGPFIFPPLAMAPGHFLAAPSRKYVMFTGSMSLALPRRCGFCRLKTLAR